MDSARARLNKTTVSKTLSNAGSWRAGPTCLAITSNFNPCDRSRLVLPEDFGVQMRCRSPAVPVPRPPCRVAVVEVRLAREFGCDRNTVRRYLESDGWAQYGGSRRGSKLDGLNAWLRERFFRHRGNAEVVRQELSWFAGLEGAFRHFGGVPEEVLVDNAKALVEKHDAATREVAFNDRFLAFAAHWGF